MTLKEQIEYKAREYAKVQLPEYNGFFLDEENTKTGRKLAEQSYKAGAEAMREIANMWVPIMTKLPPVNVEFLAKRENRRGLFVYKFNKDDIDSGSLSLLKITHWKPITL